MDRFNNAHRSIFELPGYRLDVQEERLREQEWQVERYYGLRASADEPWFVLNRRFESYVSATKFIQRFRTRLVDQQIPTVGWEAKLNLPELKLELDYFGSQTSEMFDFLNCLEKNEKPSLKQRLGRIALFNRSAQ